MVLLSHKSTKKEVDVLLMKKVRDERRDDPHPHGSGIRQNVPFLVLLCSGGENCSSSNDPEFTF